MTGNGQKVADRPNSGGTTHSNDSFLFINSIRIITPRGAMFLELFQQELSIFAFVVLTAPIIEVKLSEPTVSQESCICILRLEGLGFRSNLTGPGIGCLLNFFL